MIRIRISNVHLSAIDNINAYKSINYKLSTLFYLYCEDGEELIKRLKYHKIPYAFAECRIYKFNKDNMFIVTSNSYQIEDKLIDYTQYEKEQLQYYKLMNII